MSGSANDAADNTTVVLIRGGWTTHGMNMGQRAMQLNNTYTVNSDGSITLHVAQLPPNANLFQPGPAMLFVNMAGIPSNGSWVTIGTGNIETQPVKATTVLPASVRLNGASGSGTGNNSSSSNKNSASSTHTGAIVGGIIAAIAAVGILGAVFGICMARRRRAAARQASSLGYPMSSAPGVAATRATTMSGGGPGAGYRGSDSSAFVPLQGNESATWGPGPNMHAAASTTSLSLHSPGGAPNSPYFDDPRGNASGEFDPYHQNAPRMSTNERRGPF